MSKWDYGKGLPSIVNGTAETEAQLQQQAREAVARKLGIDPRSMVERRDKGSTEPRSIVENLGYAPVVDLKPTKIVHKEGEYGHPKFWKSEKEMTDYLTDSGKWSKKINKFRQDPAWVAEHNERFPKFKTTVLPNKEKQQPKAVTVDDWRKDNPRWKKHVADHLAKDMQTMHYNKDLGSWEDNFGEQRKGEEVFKEQQKISKMYKDQGVPESQNAKTVKQLQELKGYSQGGRVNAPYVKLNSAGNNLNAAGTANKKLSNEERRKQLYQKKWGLEEDHPYLKGIEEDLEAIDKKGKSWFSKHLKKENNKIAANDTSKGYYIPWYERMAASEAESLNQIKRTTWEQGGRVNPEPKYVTAQDVKNVYKT